MQPPIARLLAIGPTLDDSLDQESLDEATAAIDQISGVS